VGLCLGPYGGPREVEVSYERGTPVIRRDLDDLDGRRRLAGAGRALRKIWGFNNVLYRE